MRNIILASSSPRRRNLLKKYKIDFTSINSNINEEILDFYPKTTAMSLAFEKAWKLAEKNCGSIVIGADTIVAFKGEILAKPRNYEDSYNMLKKLSGKEHKVITGFSLLCVEDNIKIVDYEETKVFFRELEDREINNYIKTGEAFGKAGSYAIQGLGGLFVESIKGSYTNVIGLPMTKILLFLKENFNYYII